MDTVDIVKGFLRAQNLEQVGRRDEAAELYESAVEAGFDSSGPYDRLITIYSNTARHQDVIRVAESALEHVHTHDEKRSWYERMRAEAIKAQAGTPQAAPRARPRGQE